MIGKRKKNDGDTDLLVPPFQLIGKRKKNDNDNDDLVPSFQLSMDMVCIGLIWL